MVFYWSQSFLDHLDRIASYYVDAEITQILEV